MAKSQRRDRALFHAAAEARLPTVAVVPDENLTDVQVLSCHHLEAGRAVADHLADLGHRRIGFAGGPAHSIDSKHRLRGLRAGLAAHGITLRAGSVYSCGSWEIEAGAVLARQLLVRSLPLTALVFANDALALGFLRVAHERGVLVPQALSVVGFDGLPFGAVAWPSLTTVVQPTREMGRVACRRLFEAIAHPGRTERVQFPMELLVRESSGRPPRRDAVL